jgi:large subunit ribosomal protein L17
VLRAKAAKPLAERMITLGKRDSLHSRRQAAAFLMTTGATKKLFSDLAPRFADRPGGYTRIIRVGWRIGDGAELAILEFIGSELKKKERKSKKAVAEEAPEEKEAAAKS